MVTAEWSYLESIIEAAIWNLANLSEDVGESITTHLGLPQRLDMLMTLFRLAGKTEEASTELNKMCDKIRSGLSRKRGEVVPTRWVQGDYGSPMTYTVRARGRLERERKGLPAKRIHEVAALIATQSSQLHEFLERMGVVERD
jgi:hypothetical protein